jgi:hypothetical protein
MFLIIAISIIFLRALSKSLAFILSMDLLLAGEYKTDS